MMNDALLHPALLLAAGAIALPFLARKARPAATLLFPLLALFAVWTLPEGKLLSAEVMGYTLVLLKVDALSRIFGLIFAFIAFAGSLYAFHHRETAHQAAGLLYAAGALGVTFAGDFFTLFFFWETMAVSSTWLIWARRTGESRRAGLRYILYHVLGGGVLFSGLLLYLGNGGGLEISALAPGNALAAWLILLGVAVNAAVPPLHTWLSDAYPKATVTGAVFLSAFTTKTAVYVLIRVFPGWEVLLVAGSIMTVYGVAFAVFSNDIRGILAYHIISQVGYMVAGAGLGTEMGLNGSAAHAFSHILYKALLFMGAGALLEATGTSKLTELGGLSRKMRAALILYMVAAFSISGVPFFNGFISKSMVVAAAGEAHRDAYMLLMLLASVGTFLSVGLKLPYYAWGGNGPSPKTKPLPRNMYLAMGLVALVCVAHGIRPSLLYGLLPYPVHFEPYSAAHLVETVQILGMTLVGFWLFRKKIRPHAGVVLDLDWFYRRPAPAARKIFVEGVSSAFTATDRWALALVRRLAVLLRNPLAPFEREHAVEAYSPDRYRPPIQALILVLVLGFVLIALLGF